MHPLVRINAQALSTDSLKRGSPLQSPNFMSFYRIDAITNHGIDSNKSIGFQILLIKRENVYNSGKETNDSPYIMNSNRFKNFIFNMFIIDIAFIYGNGNAMLHGIKMREFFLHVFKIYNTNISVDTAIII